MDIHGTCQNDKQSQYEMKTGELVHTFTSSYIYYLIENETFDSILTYILTQRVYRGNGNCSELFCNKSLHGLV